MYRQIEKYQTVQINSWKEGKYDYKLTIKYGMHYLHGDYQPCFAITGSTLRKNSKGGAWVEDSIGCLHDLIQERAKHLSPLIPFHLYLPLDLWLFSRGLTTRILKMSSVA